MQCPIASFFSKFPPNKYNCKDLYRVTLLNTLYFKKFIFRFSSIVLYSLINYLRQKGNVHGQICRLCGPLSVCIILCVKIPALHPRKHALRCLPVTIQGNDTRNIHCTRNRMHENLLKLGCQLSESRQVFPPLLQCRHTC